MKIWTGKKINKQLTTTIRCWTPNIYNTLYHNHRPIPFTKTTEIIEEMHMAMIRFLLTRRRPIQLRKSLGYLELRKYKPKKPLRRVGTDKAELSMVGEGYIYIIDMKFPKSAGSRDLRFTALQRHRGYIYNEVKLKNVQ